MKAIITRADDCGSSHAANTAIKEAVDVGFIKNVSVMACGAFMEEAAEMLSLNKEICFGLHGCITSEWDKVTWDPAAPENEIPSLIDPRGTFYQSEIELARQRPLISEIITEYQYQLAKLRKAGFDIKYMDSHMFPEAHIPGLQDEMSRMIEEEGLVDHRWYYRIFPELDQVAGNPKLFEKVLRRIEGQFFFVVHPAVYGEEMCMTGNAKFPGTLIARKRDEDYRFITDKDQGVLCEKYGFRLLRYDEADILRKAQVIELASE